MNTGLPPADWDQPIIAASGSILQSREWAQFQQALGRTVVWDQGTGYQWTAVLRTSRGLRYLLCSYGPVAQDAKAATAALNSLKAAARQLNADFIRIEPQTWPTAAQLHKLGARRIHQFNAERSRIIDLTQTEAELRQALASGHRNLINGTERRGLTIHRVDPLTNLDSFMEMLGDTAQRAGVQFFDRTYFQTLCETLPDTTAMYLAEAEGKPAAAALAYDWGGTRYYAHAGAYQEANRRLKASVSLVWQMVIDAKAHGLKRFDLWGIAPDDQPSHSLAGITKFKNAFGGEPVDYVGTWDLPLKPFKYQLYTLYRRLRGMDA